MRKQFKIVPWNEQQVGDKDWCNDALVFTVVMNVSLTRAQSASRIHYTSLRHHIIHVLGAQG